MLLLCCLVVGFFAPAVSAASNVETGTYQNISWRIEGDTITISGTGVIPQPPNQNGWGGDYSHIIVEEGITGIGYYAFYGANYVTKLTLPASLTSISEEFVNLFEVPCTPNDWGYGYKAYYIEDVYFAGSQTQWNRIPGIDGRVLRYATVHCAGNETSYWYQAGGSWYYSRNGVEVTGWNVIDGNTYYMDSTGAMQTGWQSVGGNTYYLGEQGIMATGWQELSGDWYYFGTDGVMKTGWQELGGYRYYFLPDGAMVCTETNIDGQWHRFDENGHWLGRAAGWAVIDGNTYYIYEDGSAAKGWKQLDGNWYYFNAAGVMQTGWNVIGNQTYYLFPETGIMAKGFQDIDGDRYYFDNDGIMAIGWKRINGAWYYCMDHGTVATGLMLINGKVYIFDGEGRMFENTVVNDNSNNRSYYASASGALLTGWHYLEGNWYYFYKDGHMAKYTCIDGYAIDSYGRQDEYYNTSNVINYFQGCSPEQAAEADAIARQIAMEALAKGGDTDYERVKYAMEAVKDLYYTDYSNNIPLGPLYSIYGPLVLGYSGNGSGTLAMGRVLDYMGISWMGYDTIYLKMDGEYGYVNVWNRDIGYGNPSDDGTYFPFTLENGNAEGQWIQQGNKWYFYQNGQMRTGWVHTNDTWYYFNTNGTMKTGWLKDGGVWYYFDADGEMYTGWLLSGGKWYFLQKSGAMATGKFTTMGKSYITDQNGVMLTGWRKLNGYWYYLDSSGAMAVQCKKVIGGVTYCFKSDGKMCTGWYQDDVGWWYYADSSGALAKGWRTVSGKYYYFYQDNHMAANTFIDNYFVNTDGVWVSSVSVNRDPQHYKGLTADQAAQADAVARAIAQEALEKGGETDFEKISYAAIKVGEYVQRCSYGNDSDKYYRSPYGVFVAGVYTCAGATRAMGRVLEFMGYKWYHPGENQWDHQWVCVKIDGEYGWIDVQKYHTYMGFGNLLDNYVP